MKDTNSRYNKEWFDKRMKQNRNIQAFLISKINQHRESDFPWSSGELRDLVNEDLLEIAIATVNKGISITLGKGSDFDNGVDAKLSVVRSNNYGKSYASLIKCSNKEFVVSVLYENIQSKFYFFAFPVTLKEHSIPFDPTTGRPRRDNYMWEYECNSFEEAAMSNSIEYKTATRTTFENLFQ